MKFPFSGFVAGVVIAVLLSVWPSLLFAQDQSGPGSVTRLPDISIAAGIASIGTEGTPWTTPFVASLRVGLTRFLVAEVEWTQPMTASTLFDSGDIGLQTLNGQTGIYGRQMSRQDYRLTMSSVSLLARSRMGRVSFLGGAGIGHFKSGRDAVYTRTGCTGPWVAACASGNGQSSSETAGNALIVVGSVDIDVLPRLSAFVSGRIGGSNTVEEAAIAIGVRTALITDRNRRLRADPSDAPDSLVNGLVVGAAAGAGVGVLLMYFDEPRTLPAAMILGGAVGAFLDSLGSSRGKPKPRKSVSVRPVVSPSAAGVGMHMVWR